MITKPHSIATAVSMSFFLTCFPVSAAGQVDEAALRSAWALYTQQKYAASADAFEALIRTATPSARLYYYAAAANKSSNRVTRAQQLCQYIINIFPKSAEATYAQKLLADAAPKTVDGLPASLKGKSLEELMQTEEGRNSLKEALKQQRASATASPVASSAPGKTAKSGSKTENDRAFTAEVIAEDGANGVTQITGDPQGWFECSMAALAMSPRGQELIAGMIRSPVQGTYVVRFPGDNVDYTITPQKMEEFRVKDKAPWATLLHCAAFQRFHGKSSLGIEDGLNCLTGKRAEKLFATATTETALAQFIGEAIKSHNPIVCQSADDFGPLDELLETDHVYTITDFDPATKMVTIRNPHADNSRRFRLKTDPTHQKFEQLNEGLQKMHLSLFPKYFSQVARASL